MNKYVLVHLKKIEREVDRIMNSVDADENEYFSGLIIDIDRAVEDAIKFVTTKETEND